MAKREFNPKSFLMIFVSLSLAALFLFISSVFVTDVYSKLFEEQRLGMGVTVGSVTVSEATDQEALSLLQKEISKWQNQHPVSLVYNDKKVQLSSEVWLFQPEESIQRIKGTTNKLYVELNKDSVSESIYQLKVDGLNELLDEEMLFAHLKKLGGNLQTTELEVPVNEFLTTFGQAEEVVSQSSVEMPGEHLLLDDWVKELEGYEIKAGATFSLIGAIEEVGLTAQDSIDLNVLANGIYAAVQKTNFSIIERHTSRQLPSYSSLGNEAFVKPTEMDFAFQNINASPYKLEFTTEEGNLLISIVGVPLPYTYKMKLDKQIFKPKTIIHFNDQLTSILSSVVVDSGSEGYLIKVYRDSFGSGGELVESVKLAEDFYPPRHRIEERGYPIEERGYPIEEEVTTDPMNPDNGVPGMPYPYPYPTDPSNPMPTYPTYPYPAYPYDPNNPTLPVLPGLPGQGESAADTGNGSAPEKVDPKITEEKQANKNGGVTK